MRCRLSNWKALRQNGSMEMLRFLHSFTSLICPSSVPSDSVSVPSPSSFCHPFLPLVVAVVEHSLSFLTKIDGLWCIIIQNGTLMWRKIQIHRSEGWVLRPPPVFAFLTKRFIERCPGSRQLFFVCVGGHHRWTWVCVCIFYNFNQDVNLF